MCGASETEKQYLEGFCKHRRDQATKVKFLTKGVDPLTLVRKAARERELRHRDCDEVWCVVDVDEFELEAALKIARETGIKLAVSNRCFEYWLLLHFEDCATEFRRAEDVTERLRRHVPGYDKTNLEFDDFSQGVYEAAERAKGRCEFGREYLHNPSSGVWRLIEEVTPARPGAR